VRRDQNNNRRLATKAATNVATRSSRCKACSAKTIASGGYCQRCKSLRHHGLKQIKDEQLLLDQAGGSWWIWNPRGDVLVSGKPTATDAVIALAAGEDNDADDADAHSVRRIRTGTRGRIVDVDGNKAAALYQDGNARVRVLQRLYFPDAVLVEVLNDGPWGSRGTTGQVALRYFLPDPKA
jgi:hypothetical protein